MTTVNPTSHSQALKEEIDNLYARISSWEEWKDVTSDWCNSLIDFLFGDTLMGGIPQINALQDQME